jgi:hypothetical protein
MQNNMNIVLINNSEVLKGGTLGLRAKEMFKNIPETFCSDQVLFLDN